MKPVIITMGLLCWNTKDVSVESAVALCAEADRLRILGSIPRVVVLDNGSTDGTHKALLQARLDATVLRVSGNIGISRARNLFIRSARIDKADFLLLMDGDVQVIPNSVGAMIECLTRHPELSALAPNPTFTTRDPHAANTTLTYIDDSLLSSDTLMYLCGYGLFKREVFERCIFDTFGPFGEMGWGHEDDDFWLQMQSHHLQARYIGGVLYLHRRPRSSWVALKAEGVDALTTFERRKAYLLQKWQTERVSSGILNQLRAQGFSHA